MTSIPLWVRLPLQQSKFRELKEARTKNTNYLSPLGAVEPYFCVCFSQKTLPWCFPCSSSVSIRSSYAVEGVARANLCKAQSYKNNKTNKTKDHNHIQYYFRHVIWPWWTDWLSTWYYLIGLPWQVFPEGLNVKLWDGTKSIHVRFESASSKHHRILVSFGLKSDHDRYFIIGS